MPYTTPHIVCFSNPIFSCLFLACSCASAFYSPCILAGNSGRLRSSLYPLQMYLYPSRSYPCNPALSAATTSALLALDDRRTCMRRYITEYPEVHRSIASLNVGSCCSTTQACPFLCLKSIDAVIFVVYKMDVLADFESSDDRMGRRARLQVNRACIQDEMVKVSSKHMTMMCVIMLN